MAANTAPIFSASPDVQWGTSLINTANTAKNGTGTTTNVFTAGINGSYVQRIRVRSAGTNVQTVIRVFINNGLDSTTASNNILFDELTIAATSISENTAQPSFEIPLNFAIQAGYRLNVTIGTAVAAGLYVSVIGGDY